MKIAVMGSGTMGTGIAQAFAAADHEVLVCDINKDIAKVGVDKVGKKLA
jgi:3-hydroxybutyryl-CoA dehydrogenase